MGAQAEMKRGRAGWAAAVLALLALALPAAAAAAPPANDDFADATAIGSGTYFGTTAEATREPSVPNPGGDVWYAWTAPDATPVTIETCAKSLYGGEYLDVYTGDTLETLQPAETTSSDYCGGWGDIVDLKPEAGRTYLILVEGWNEPGPFRLRVGPRVPPETTITSGVAEGGTTDDWLPVFTFASSDPEANFQCSVDGREFGWCYSPQHITLGVAPLPPGPHTLQVRAKSLIGTVDPTPAVRHFTVVEAAKPPNPFDELLRKQCEERLKKQGSLERRVRKAKRRLRRARGPIAKWKAKSRLMHAQRQLADFSEYTELSCASLVPLRGGAG
jgi:hypothetical protein